MQNIERYGDQSNRASVDQLFNRVYNPDTQIPHPPPWPLERTQFDMAMQKTWCPSCAPSVEGFQLKNQSYITRDLALTLQDPDNPWSFRASKLYKY